MTITLSELLHQISLASPAELVAVQTLLRAMQAPDGSAEPRKRARGILRRRITKG